MSSSRNIGIWKDQQQTKPQNWDKAKPVPGTYLCLMGCCQRILKSEENIHGEHCPAKKLFMLYRMESRRCKNSSGTISKMVENTDIGLSDLNEEKWMDDIELSEKELRERKRIQDGKYYFRKLKGIERVDLVDAFMEGIRWKQSAGNNGSDGS